MSESDDLLSCESVFFSLSYFLLSVVPTVHVYVFIYNHCYRNICNRCKLI